MSQELKKTVTLNVRVTETTAHEFRDLCDRQGIDPSRRMRQLIRADLRADVLHAGGQATPAALADEIAHTFASAEERRAFNERIDSDIARMADGD